MVLAEPRYTSSKIFQPPSTGVVGIGGGNGAFGLVMGKYLLEGWAINERRLRSRSSSCRGRARSSRRNNAVGRRPAVGGRG